MADPASPTGVDAMEVDVVVDDQQSAIEIDADRWGRLASVSMAQMGAGGELTLTFVDRDEIAELNAEHMGVTGPTDVLSFPLDVGDDADAPAVAGQPRLLGDIVICPDVAAANAPTHAGTLDDELALLVVHGCLHIVGHDHVGQDETRVMRAHELELLTAHHWGGPPPAGFRQDHES